MTFSEVNPGGWALNEILTSAQMNALQSQLVDAVDGVGGGTYTLTAPLIFGGDNVRLDSDSIGIVSGGLLDVQSGGTAQVSSGGAILLLTGSTTTIAASADVDCSGDIDMLNSGQLRFLNTTLLEMSATSELRVNAGCNFNLADVDDLSLAGDVVTAQWDQVPLAIEPDGSGDPSWERIFTLGGWRLADAQVGLNPGRVMLVPIRPKENDDITEIRVAINGGTHVALPVGLPTLELYRVNPDTGVTTLVAGPVTDPSATQPAYDADHFITMSGIAETANGHPYYLQIEGEHDTNALNDQMRVLGVRITYAARSFRRSQEVQ